MQNTWDHRQSCVLRWSGGSCNGGGTPVNWRSSGAEHNPLTFDDVSGLFLVVTSVVLLCVIVSASFFVLRRHQLRGSNDQASLSSANQVFLWQVLSPKRLKTKRKLLFLSQCSQRLYLLKLLRSQGLSTAQLDQVSQAIIVSRLRYALPVWSGFLSADLINRIQALLKRLFKFGYSSQLLSFHDLITSCSEDLFDNAHISNQLSPWIVILLCSSIREPAPEVMISFCLPVPVTYINVHF